MKDYDWWYPILVFVILLFSEIFALLLRPGVI